MIGYLRGKIMDHSDGRMLVVLPSAGPNSAESGAVGYSVTVPQSAVYGAALPGQWVELFIYTHVREDALDLYGFLSKAEKELFLTFLSVTGIGPKGAMGILAGAEAEQLIEAITSGDKAFLTSMPGIGKKTAERVVLELAEPLRKKVENGLLGQIRSSYRSAPAASGKTGSSTGTAGRSGEMIRDAKAALVGLGYREQEIAPLLNRLVTDPEQAPSKPEDLIRLALRQLNTVSGARE